MTNVVLLVLVLLAGGAGWWAGNRSGADAREALTKTQQLGKQALQEHDRETTSLKQQLAKINADFERAQQAREAQQAKDKQALDAALAGRDKTISDLKRNVASQQSLLIHLQQQLADPALPTAKREAMQGDFDRLNATLQLNQQRVHGMQCSKVPVPDELLQPLRLGS